MLYHEKLKSSAKEEKINCNVKNGKKHFSLFYFFSQNFFVVEMHFLNFFFVQRSCWVRDYHEDDKKD